jgi:hypothetical protein
MVATHRKRGQALIARSGKSAVGVWSGTVRLSDFLYLSFVFIDILALFPRFYARQVEESTSRGVIRRLPACGPRTCGPRVVWHCTTQRHFVLILCFHRHSRFVPPILQSVSGGVQKSRIGHRLPACDPSPAVDNGCPIPRQRSADLPTCPPALAFALLDFSTVL